MDCIVALFGNILSFVTTFVITTLILVVGLFALYKVWKKLQYKSDIQKNLQRKDRTIFFIKIPNTNEQKETAMEEFLRNLHRVLPNNMDISLEMSSENQFLKFYIVVPTVIKGIIEPQLYAQYPDAEVEIIEEYLPPFDSKTSVEQLYFKRSSLQP